MRSTGTFLGLAMLAVMFFLLSFMYESIPLSLLAMSIITVAIYARFCFVYELENLKLDVERSFLDKMAFQAKPVSVVLSIVNYGASRHLRIEDGIPENAELAQGANTADLLIHSGERVKLRYSVRPLKRGLLCISETNITVRSRTGLFYSKLTLPNRSEIVVHTKEESIKRGLQIAKKEHLEITGMARQRWLRTRDFEFRGLRDYIPGDRFRDIHWKSLSKLQKLLTKVYEKEAMIPTTILLDCSSSMRITSSDFAKIDHGVNLSLEIARILLSGYHPTGLVLFDEIGMIEKVSPELRKNQFQLILKALRNTPAHIRSKEIENRGEVGGDEEAPRETEHRAYDSEESEKFLSTLAAFASKKGGRQSRVGLEGIMASGIARGRRKGQLYILISDLEASRDSILRGAALAVMNDHQMILATPFSYWYELTSDELAIEDLEEMYIAYTSMMSVQRRLKKMGILTFELGPRDEITKVTKAVRRKLA